MADNKKRDEEGKIPRVTKTCKAFLQEIDGVRLPIGEFSITEPEPGPSIDQFADRAFAFARASLSKLMPQRYRVVVVDEHQQEHAWGLQRWVKLYDRQAEHEERMRGEGKKQRLRRSA